MRDADLSVTEWRLGEFGTQVGKRPEKMEPDGAGIASKHRSSGVPMAQTLFFQRLVFQTQASHSLPEHTTTCQCWYRSGMLWYVLVRSGM